MRKYFETIRFVVILGLFTSTILLGMEYITNKKIEAVIAARFKQSVLEAHSLSYTQNNVNDIYEAEITELDLEDVTFYVSNTTGNITFEFSGGGVWGPISGIITLDSNFELIVNIIVLVQEETPGLGGIVAEDQYLETFVGKSMLPSIDIIKDAITLENNQVDSITGATKTSDAFETILNTTYSTYKTIWDNQ
ncbi:hypothetical protein CI105_06190 [Candidatus Izimaplasma bacterium ZiA1]|uniref:FMN-binding protein n=1 Tax=Candidatus Izimoplasma sp. ZiA1 TaxID=2024899 RepID=UPI000BAA7AF6|nr:hypothetical protein CI105_06190 [Candidatus Izimaplasma bacterium ZiA1]